MDINPLNVLNKRVVEMLPPHFEKITLPIQSSWMATDIIRRMKHWIFTNLEHRFYIQEDGSGSSTFGSADSKVIVGFEDPAEATYFSIAYQDDDDVDDGF